MAEHFSDPLSTAARDFAARADLASREQQITVANRLYAKSGLQPWGLQPLTEHHQQHTQKLGG